MEVVSLRLTGYSILVSVVVAGRFDDQTLNYYMCFKVNVSGSSDRGGQ